jgi:hypothetical protein
VFVFWCHWCQNEGRAPKLVTDPSPPPFRDGPLFASEHVFFFGLSESMSNFKDAKLALRKRLEALPYNEVICDESILEILRKHPKYHEARLMKCRHASDFVICVVDTEGCRGDSFSWTEGLRAHRGMKTGYKDQHYVRVNIAARQAIADQVRKVRVSHQIVGDSRFEVDHETPFRTLFNMWLDERKLTIDDIAVTKSDRTLYFTDPTLQDNWALFHRKWAILRVLTTEEHRRITASSRRAQGAC